MDNQLFWLLVGAAILRLLLLIYGEYHDRTHTLKYTDIDYVIFSDAARLVTVGDSPYMRTTYRYTPLIAWLLVPTVNFLAVGGKLVFVAFDLAVGVFIYRLGMLTAINTTYFPGIADMSVFRRAGAVCAAAWLLNPLVANISTRGSADAVAMLPIVAFVLALWEWRPAAAGAWLALAVHIRLFPVIFGPLALAFFLFGGRPAESTSSSRGLVPSRRRGNAPARAPDRRLAWKGRLRAVTVFLFSGAVVLGALTGVGYAAYGYDFLWHSYLYHFTRADHRHNFSPYWLSTYLAQSAGQAVPWVISKGVFIAQISITALLAWRLRWQPAAATYAITHAFVTLNKVVTVQYFAWWLSLLPLALLSSRCLPFVDYVALGPGVSDGLRPWWMGATAGLLIMVVGTMVWWVRASYLVEMQGEPQWMQLFVASVCFTCTNAAVVAAVVGAVEKAPPPAAETAEEAELRHAAMLAAEDAMFDRVDAAPLTTSASPTKPAQRATPLKKISVR